MIDFNAQIDQTGLKTLNQLRPKEVAIQSNSSLTKLRANSSASQVVDEIGNNFNRKILNDLKKYDLDRLKEQEKLLEDMATKGLAADYFGQVDINGDASHYRSTPQLKEQSLSLGNKPNVNVVDVLEQIVVGS